MGMNSRNLLLPDANACKRKTNTITIAQATRPSYGGGKTRNQTRLGLDLSRQITKEANFCPCHEIKWQFPLKTDQG